MWCDIGKGAVLCDAGNELCGAIQLTVIWCAIQVAVHCATIQVTILCGAMGNAASW